MRTLALLAALLLLAFHAQAQPLGENDDQVPAQDQPGAEVQGMTISFEGDERSTRDASGSRSALICHCSFSCRSPYKKIGYCHLRRLHFCCPSWLNFVD
uniref:Paneth cell-specific alpha-defensin 25 n=1 Tax=Equus caballus TaxID=9796 RepID=C8BNH8_HORSE|nr:Paneth cell-specific alpha-defensin 25 precursor [Equus caballus]ACV49751.1 Paneth cell-specific alpha-defensin 25 [Equus caballus]